MRIVGGVRLVVTLSTAVLGVSVLGMSVATAAPAEAAAERGPAAAYRIVDLPPLPGASESFPLAMNGRGDVVGYSGGHAALWRRGQVLDLGTLGGEYSGAIDINERGDIVGYSRIGIADHAFLWRNGRMIDLGTLPGDLDSRPSAINDQGEIVGGSVDRWYHGRAVLWRPDGSIVDLTARTGMHSVSDIDNSGRLVGDVAVDDLNAVPALWDSGRTTILSDTFGTATAINNRGEIAGFLRDFDAGILRSFFWRQGRLTEIPRLPGLPADEEMHARAVNDRGQVVGYSITAGLAVGGFIWDIRSGLTALPGVPGVETAAFDVDDRGRIVAAARTNWEDHEPRAVLLIPVRRPQR